MRPPRVSFSPRMPRLEAGTTGRSRAAAAPLMLVALLGFGAVACGTRAQTPEDFDRPVPASEPRAELIVTLDLPAGSDCEAIFDAALYVDRGVDLAQWDDVEGCRGRRLRLRYLPQRIDRARLLARIQELAVPGTVKEITR
jgi:hypothetical protein